MEKKIIKIQLYTLFALTFLNITYFSLHDSLPDNYFEISYQNDSVNIITYYLSTILANFGYWCGIWITSSFVIFALLNTLLLSKKQNESTTSFIALFLTLSCFSICYLLAPISLGEGLYSLINDYIGHLYMALLFIASSLALFYFVSEAAFMSFFKKCYEILLNVPRFLSEVDYSRFKEFNFATLFKKGETLKDSVKTNAQKIQTLRVKKTDAPKHETSSTPVEKKAAPIIPSFEMDENDDAVSDSVLNEKTADEEDSVETLVSPVQFTSPEDVIDEEVEAEFEDVDSPFVTRVAKEDTFFKADELIDCIAPQKVSNTSNDPDENYFVTIAHAIEAKLLEFNIRASVINVLKGPVVDTFELELGAGVKVAGVTNRTDDLSLALMGAPIRMVYPMKGKSTIGIEVPRNPRDLIYLDEVLKSHAFLSSNLRLPIAMGKDAYGDAAVVDLASTPHLLVAGTTGAGKSVFINTMLVSLIIKLSPKKLRLIMIDPKQLELALYQTLPHLIMPVVTDPQIASISLMWTIDEMERRYSLLKDFGVKNIEGFNKKIKTAGHELLCKINKYYEDVDAMDYEMPYIVVVVDEFADLVLSKSGKAIENSISRLAAKARASGIHIVLATQRPSTDVITGVIKANFPTRVSFRVTTNMDSRVVLDTMGAEKLLGKGDMLFKQGIETLRMHSAYVDEEEIETLVSKLSEIPAQFDASAVEYIENNGSAGEDAEGGIMGLDGDNSGLKDEKFEEAVKIVALHRMASASFLQRRLGVGYNRAANLIEEMERQGVVGPAQGSKPRKVLIAPME